MSTQCTPFEGKPRGGTWWSTPLAAALAASLGGGLSTYLGASHAATLKRSTEYHNLFQQTLQVGVADEVRYSVLLGICRQSDDAELRRSAHQVLAGLGATCWATCGVKLSACEEGGRTLGDCENALDCDEICDLLKCAAGQSCDNDQAPRCPVHSDRL